MFENVFYHRAMLGDHVRMKAYRKGIGEAVTEGDTVADIGTGSGILSFFALEAGASKVYALERNEIIEEAKRLAEINGWNKNIIFLKGASDRIDLPEKVDVIVSELIGHFGLEENLLPYKIDARERFLKQGGRLVPAWLELYLVPIASKEIWEDHIGIWDEAYYGVNLSPVKKHAVAQRYIADCKDKVKLLADPCRISHIDFYKIEKIPHVFEAKYRLHHKGILHGLMGYFKAGLSRNVILSTSAHEPTTHWQQTFFPMEEIISVNKGDSLSCRLNAIPQMNTIYWEWNTRLIRKENEIVSFSQSNLDISKEELVVGRRKFRPCLTLEGMIHRKVLDLCDGKRSIGEISDILMKMFPDEIADEKDAMQRTVEIVRPVTKIL